MILPTKLKTEIQGLINKDITKLTPSEIRYHLEDLVDEAKYETVGYIPEVEFYSNITIEKPELQYLNRVETAYSLFMDTLITTLDQK